MPEISGHVELKLFYCHRNQDRRGGGGQGGNTWGPEWLEGPEFLVKRLVMGATSKRVGGP